MTVELARNILGITLDDATPVDIKKHYRKAALKAHPDQGGSAEGMHLVTQAYEFLLSAPTIRKMPVTHDGILNIIVI